MHLKCWRSANTFPEGWAIIDIHHRAHRTSDKRAEEHATEEIGRRVWRAYGAPYTGGSTKLTATDAWA